MERYKLILGGNDHFKLILGENNHFQLIIQNDAIQSASLVINGLVSPIYATVDIRFLISSLQADAVQTLRGLTKQQDILLYTKAVTALQRMTALLDENAFYISVEARETLEVYGALPDTEHQLTLETADAASMIGRLTQLLDWSEFTLGELDDMTIRNVEYIELD